MASMAAYADRGPSMTAVYSLGIAVSTIAVILRFVARRLNRNALLIDDWMMVAGLVLTIGEAAAGIYAVRLGAGRHIIFILDPVRYAKVMLSIEILYTAAAALIKFSTLSFYYRIFNCNRRFKHACWTVAAFVAAYSVGQIIETLLQCQPLSKMWNTEAPGTCVPANTSTITPAVINVILNIATVVLPIPLIWNLQLQWRRKAQILGVFLLGGFVIIASIIFAAKVKDLSHEDATWNNSDPCLWSMAENTIGIMCTCLVAMGPLYAMVKRGHFCRVTETCSRCRLIASRKSGTGTSQSGTQLSKRTTGITRLDSMNPKSSNFAPVIVYQNGEMEQQWVGGDKGSPELRAASIDSRLSSSGSYKESKENV